jgi:hypothetical protein
MTKNEHVTALFVGGLYYWLIDEERTAEMCWRTAADILHMAVEIVGEA